MHCYFSNLLLTFSRNMCKIFLHFKFNLPIFKINVKGIFTFQRTSPMFRISPLSPPSSNPHLVFPIAIKFKFKLIGKGRKVRKFLCDCYNVSDYLWNARDLFWGQQLITDFVLKSWLKQHHL